MITGSNIQLYNWMSESQKFSTFRERASFSHFFSLANDSFAIDHRTLTLNITKVKTHRLNWLNSFSYKYLSTFPAMWPDERMGGWECWENNHFSFNLSWSRSLSWGWLYRCGLLQYATGIN